MAQVEGDIGMGRNREIDLYRILFALIIVLVHSHGLRVPDPTHYPFCGGYLAVEFFLMLTGYFSVRKAEHSGNVQTAAQQAAVWTGRKFLRLYQYVIPAVILHYLVSAWMQRLSAYETVKQLLYGTFEMLLLPASGIYETFLVLPLWYLSALLLTLPLFYYTVIRLKNVFFPLLAPLSTLLIYGYFSVTFGHLDIWSVWMGAFFISLLRAWAGLCLGGLCYILEEWLKGIPFSKMGLIMLQGVKLLCITCTLFIMLTKYHQRLDFLCVGALFIALAITFSRLREPFQGKSDFLAELSLALYVSHWTIREIIPVVMPEATYKEMLGPYLLLSILYASMFVVGVKAVRKLSLPERLKHCFLLQECK